jgi:hypothetical protein
MILISIINERTIKLYWEIFFEIRWTILIIFLIIWNRLLFCIPVIKKLEEVWNYVCTFLSLRISMIFFLILLLVEDTPRIFHGNFGEIRRSFILKPVYNMDIYDHSTQEYFTKSLMKRQICFNRRQIFFSKLWNFEVRAIRLINEIFSESHGRLIGPIFLDFL